MKFLLAFFLLFIFKTVLLNGWEKVIENLPTDVEKGNVKKKTKNFYKVINYQSSELIYLIANFPHQLTNNI